MEEHPVAPLAVADARGCVVAWSAAAALLVRRDATEAVGRSAADLPGVPADWPAGPDEWHGRAELRNRDGRRLRVPVAACRCTGGDRAGPLWLLLREREEGLAAERALAGWVLTGCPVGVTVYDTRLRFVRQNETMRRITGVPDEERAGQALSAVLSGTDVSEWEARMRRVPETGGRRRVSSSAGAPRAIPLTTGASPPPPRRCATGPAG